MAAFDILGMGCVAVDELLFVAAYPAADTKTPIRRRDRQCGGLAFTALIAAARLGCRCAYAGMLGVDDDSRFVIDHFQREGIDLTYLRNRPEVRPIRAQVIVDESCRTRTILYDLEGAVGAEPDWPPEEAIRAAGVSVDRSLRHRRECPGPLGSPGRPGCRWWPTWNKMNGPGFRSYWLWPIT